MLPFWYRYLFHIAILVLALSNRIFYWCLFKDNGKDANPWEGVLLPGTRGLLVSTDPGYRQGAVSREPFRCGGSPSMYY